MKKWSKPELLSLNVSLTSAGGYGLPIDGVVYQVGENDQVVGTSGPPLDYPVVGHM